MIKATLEGIEAFIKTLGLKTEKQAETEQLIVTLSIEQRDYPMFIRAYGEGSLIQFLTFIPCQVQSRYNAELARLLHHLNKEMDMPGLGMDEASNTVFYRVMVPIFTPEIKEDLIKAYIATSERVCDTFAGVIAAVANGIASFEEVLKKAEEGMKDAQVE